MIKITIECKVEDLLSIIAGDSFVSVASEGESVNDNEDGEGDGEGETGDNGNNEDGNKKEDLPNRPGTGVGITGPGRPSDDESGEN